MIGLIVINLILSMLVGKIASDYGRSSIGWFCFSFFASPIVAGVVLFIIGSVDDDIGGIKSKIGPMQSQISDNQRKNDYRITQIDEKIKALEKTVYGSKSSGLEQNQKILLPTKPSIIIDQEYRAWKKIMELKEQPIDLNCPIRLNYGQIRRDTLSNKRYAILDFLNVGEKVVDGVKVKLQYRENSNAENVDEVFFYQYVKAARLQHFGINEPLEIKGVLDEQYVEVQIGKILFTDGTVWMVTDSKFHISEISHSELKILRRMEGEDVLRLAKQEEVNWYCVCGMKNMSESEKCQLCGRWKDYVLESYTSIEEYPIVDIDKYIDTIEEHENINDIENTIGKMEEEGILKEKSAKEIHEILKKYHNIQRVYGVSKNDLDMAKKEVLEILKNIED